MTLSEQFTHTITPNNNSASRTFQVRNYELDKCAIILLLYALLFRQMIYTEQCSGNISIYYTD